MDVSILILLDYLFLYEVRNFFNVISEGGLNPYFIGLPILIEENGEILFEDNFCLNPYFIGLPILIIKLTNSLK